MRLWFKACYVPAILAGEKRSTLRRDAGKLRPGDTVWFSVGPRPAFALAQITELHTLTVARQSRERRDALAKLYPGALTVCEICWRYPVLIP